MASMPSHAHRLRRRIHNACSLRYLGGGQVQAQQPQQPFCYMYPIVQAGNLTSGLVCPSALLSTRTAMSEQPNTADALQYRGQDRLIAVPCPRKHHVALSNCQWASWSETWSLRAGGLGWTVWEGPDGRLNRRAVVR